MRRQKEEPVRTHYFAVTVSCLAVIALAVIARGQCTAQQAAVGPMPAAPGPCAAPSHTKGSIGLFPCIAVLADGSFEIRVAGKALGLQKDSATARYARAALLLNSNDTAALLEELRAAAKLRLALGTGLFGQRKAPDDISLREVNRCVIRGIRNLGYDASAKVRAKNSPAKERLEFAVVYAEMSAQVAHAQPVDSELVTTAESMLRESGARIETVLNELGDQAHARAVAEARDAAIRRYESDVCGSVGDYLDGAAAIWKAIYAARLPEQEQAKAEAHMDALESMVVRNTYTTWLQAVDTYMETVGKLIP